MTATWLLTAALWVASDDVIHTRDRAFRIPLDITENERKTIAAVRLMVSTDSGKTWQRVREESPKRPTVTFRAPGDGLYWLALAVIGHDERMRPADPRELKPGLKVLVDSTQPEISLEAVKTRSGLRGVRWTLNDVVTPESLRLHVAVWDEISQIWKPRGLTDVKNNTLWFARAEKITKMQLQAVDLAGNEAVMQIDIDGDRFICNSERTFVFNNRAPAAREQIAQAPERKTEQPEVSPASFKQEPAPTKAPERTVSAKPVAAQPSALPKSDAAPTQAMKEPVPVQPAPKKPKMEPAPVKAAPPAVKESPKSEPPNTMPAKQEAPKPLPIQGSVPVSPLPEKRPHPKADDQPSLRPQLDDEVERASGSELEENSQVPPPILKRTNREAEPTTLPQLPERPKKSAADRRSYREMKSVDDEVPVVTPEPEAEPEVIPPKKQKRRVSPPVVEKEIPEEEMPEPEGDDEPTDDEISYSNRRTVVLHYELDVDPEARAVTFWGTMDGGKTWRLLGADEDLESPLHARFPRDGRWGVRLAIADEAGDGKPDAGDEPVSIVEIDTQKPKIRFAKPRYERDWVRLGWIADDRNLVEDSIRLSYSLTPDGPWRMIVTQQEADGEYIWKPAADESKQPLYFRVDATDRAGNIGVSFSNDPVSSEPKAKPVPAKKGETPIVLPDEVPQKKSSKQTRIEPSAEEE